MKSILQLAKCEIPSVCTGTDLNDATRCGFIDLLCDFLFGSSPPGLKGPDAPQCRGPDFLFFLARFHLPSAIFKEQYTGVVQTVMNSGTSQSLLLSSQVFSPAAGSTLATDVTSGCFAAV